MLLFNLLSLAALMSDSFGAAPVNNCTSEFPSSLSREFQEEGPLEVQGIRRGFYLFPDLQFDCEVNIRQLEGYFLVHPDHSRDLYFQVWRENSTDPEQGIHLVEQYELDLDDDDFCKNYSDNQCYVKVALSDGFTVNSGDYIGFFSFDNSQITRPLFSSYGPSTELCLVQTRENQQFISYDIDMNCFNVTYPRLAVTSVEEEEATITAASTTDYHTNHLHVATIIIVCTVIGCVLAMAIVISAVIVLYKKRLKSLRRGDLVAPLPGIGFTSAYQRILDRAPMNELYYRFNLPHNEPALSESYVNISDEFQRTYEVPFKLPSTDLEDMLGDLPNMEISSDCIELGTEIGSGHFGMVVHGVWNHDEQAEQVAIKTLHGEASMEDKTKLLKEAAIIGQFAHNNIVKLCGVVTSGDPMMIIFEYLSKGDLQHFLSSVRPKDCLPVEEITPQMLLGFARDIGCGMNYLSNKHFIHRDLAARNILLTEDNVCKIADFGMTRDLEDDYYIAHGGAIPVKWTAPEALLYRRYTTASDVWSYGVVLYEMWSLGQKPFRDCSVQEVIELLKTGYRLPPPPGCPRQIYSTMIQCWNPAHRLRPTFSALLQTISQPHYVLFHWIEEDRQTGAPQCDLLGAPLEAGHNLYLDLQNMYK